MESINIRDCFEREPAAIDFILPGMIHGTVGALISPGGHGKSFLAMQLAIQIASGADVLGWKRILKTGKVAYLAGEDPDVALHDRLHNLGKHLTLCEREEVIENLSVHPLVGDPKIADRYTGSVACKGEAALPTPGNPQGSPARPSRLPLRRTASGAEVGSRTWCSSPSSGVAGA